MEWILFALACAVFFGLRQVLTKKVLFAEHASEFLSATCLVGFLLSLFFIPWMDFSIPLTTWGLMYLKCLIFTFAWLLAVKALRHLEISFVIPLTNLTPLFILLWGVLFLGESPSAVQLGGVALVVLGAYWLQSDHNFRNLLRPWSVFRSKFAVFMMVAVFCYSICASIDRVVMRTVNVYTYLSFTLGVLAVHYMIIQFVKYNGLKDMVDAFRKERSLIFVIPLLILFADMFYLKAVAIPAAMISLIIPIKRMSTLVASVIGGRMFHEHNFGFRMIGGLMMLTGVVLIVI
jgi:drug/metabolite transporter (DMT)-like permease